MSELISGKEALIALANGQEVQHCNKKMTTFVNLVKDEEWGCCDELTISDFNSDVWAFRLKPRTITLSGIEVPAPFKPKSGDMVWCLNELSEKGYEARTAYKSDDFIAHIAYWQTEEQIKQVVAALRTIFK